MSEITGESLRAEQKEIIEVTKNTKGYNWKIRVLNLDVEALAKINQRCIEQFGSLE